MFRARSYAWAVAPLLLSVSCTKVDLTGEWHWICYCDGQELDDVRTIEDDGDGVTVTRCSNGDQEELTRKGDELSGAPGTGLPFQVINADLIQTDILGDDSEWACRIGNQAVCDTDPKSLEYADCKPADL
jgi:hypothetical protein